MKRAALLLLVLSLATSCAHRRCYCETHPLKEHRR